MKRTVGHRLLLLLALMHLLADVGLAGGAVLCVGPNDHTAIEIGHLAPGCADPAEVLAQEVDGTSVVGATRGSADCTDTSLHAEAEMAPKSVSSDFDSPAEVAAQSFNAPSIRASRTDRPAQRLLDVAMAIRAHRSIVLLI